MGELSGSGTERQMPPTVRSPRPAGALRDWRADWRAGWRHRVLVALGYFLGWAVIAVPVALHTFFNDHRDTVVAGHDVVVSPTHDSWATFDLGAFLPDVRYPTDGPLGVHIDVGATNLDDYSAMIR